MLLQHQLIQCFFSSLNNAYDEIIESIAKAAKDHADIADIVTSQVTDVLKALERRNEDAKKKVFMNLGRLWKLHCSTSILGNAIFSENTCG